MFTVKVKKKGKKLQRLKTAVKKLNGQTVEAGFFASQGKHLGGEYSYAGLAQALELGYFPVQGIVRVPMPFMNHIGKLTASRLKRDPNVNKAFKYWGKRPDKKGNLQALLNTLGEAAIASADHVFNNKVYFPQAPSNMTPIFETGDLRRHFTYKTSLDNKVRRIYGA